MIPALFAALALAQEPQPPITAEPDRRVEIELSSYYSPRRLALTLAEVATKYPELVRVETLGQSEAGTQIPVVTLARLEGEDPLARPAMLVVAGFGQEDLFSTELALALIRHVLQENRRDPSVAELLDRCVLHVVPCLDVDLRERVFTAITDGRTEVAPRAVELDRNFPGGWDPLGHAASGPYPLSVPEARALADFLVARPNIAVCQRFRGAGTRADAAPAWAVPDLGAARELAGELGFDGLESLAGGAGSFLRFAYGDRGALVFRAPATFERGGPWALPPVQDLAQLGRQAAQASLKLTRALARLELGAPTISTLAPGQWTVELVLNNTGRLPTSTARARELGTASAPILELTGARLVAAALIRGEESIALPPKGTRLELPDLSGRESVTLRLFLSGDAGVEVTTSVRSTRAGSSRVSFALR